MAETPVKQTATSKVSSISGDIDLVANDEAAETQKSLPGWEKRGILGAFPV
jgi:hypothetical protein